MPCRHPFLISFASVLFNRNAFCKVSRHIHIVSALHGGVICKQLHGQYGKCRRIFRHCIGNFPNIIGNIIKEMVAFAHKRQYFGAAYAAFRNIAFNFLGKLFLKRNCNHQRALFQKSNGTVLKLACRKRFGVNIGYLFKLERRFLSYGIAARYKKTLSRP